MRMQLFKHGCIADIEMTADLFAKYKHVKRHDYDYNMTCYTSMRLTLVRVPEYC